MVLSNNALIRRRHKKVHSMRRKGEGLEDLARLEGKTVLLGSAVWQSISAIRCLRLSA